MSSICPDDYWGPFILPDMIVEEPPLPPMPTPPDIPGSVPGLDDPYGGGGGENSSPGSDIIDDETNSPWQEASLSDLLDAIRATPLGQTYEANFKECLGDFARQIGLETSEDLFDMYQQQPAITTGLTAAALAGALIYLDNNGSLDGSFSFDYAGFDFGVSADINLNGETQFSFTIGHDF
jgi:hypothetical protein